MNAATLAARAVMLAVVAGGLLFLLAVALHETRPRKRKPPQREQPFTQAELAASRERVDEVMRLERLYRLPAREPERRQRHDR